MKHPPALREEAHQLRRNGHSLKEIATLLGISSATSWAWCRDIKLAPAQQHRLDQQARARHDKARKKAHARWKDIGKARRARWEKEAAELWDRHQHEPLFMVGLGLYWGEGGKSAKNSSLELTNSDPGVVQAWLAWCKVYIPGGQHRFWVQAHRDVDEVKARAFWVETLGLTEEPFGFSVTRSSASKRVRRDNGRRLPFGTIRVTLREGSSEWYHKMMALLGILARFTSVEHRLQPDV